MTWKLYLELTSPQFFPGKSWVGRRCCQMLHCMVGFYTVQVQDEDSTGVGSKNRRHSTREKKKKCLHHLCISVLRLYYLCYTNKLFRPCPKQKPECGGFIGGYTFPLTSCTAIKPASQRCELTYFRYSWIKVITLLICNTNHTQPRINGDVSISLQPDSMPRYMKVFVFGFTFHFISLISLTKRGS